MSKRFTHVSGAVVAAVAVLAAASMAGGASAALATDPARAAVRPTLAPAFSGRLYGVTALSATDAWAVGLYPTGALILHWNGKTWTSHDISGCCFLESVAATSPANAWAVGGTGWFTTEPLIEHWNDRAWTKASVQAPAAGGYLNGVAVVSASDAWAVGWTGGGPGDGTGPGDATLIEHWNGRAWTRVPSPAPAPLSGLSGVAATSATNVWAVGWTGVNGENNGTLRTLILHWNGRDWTRTPSPSNVPGVRTSLNAVAALSADDAWAVGSTHQDRNRITFIVHWNGTTWTRVPAPTPFPGTSLLGVAAASARDIWAVGQRSYESVCSPDSCLTAIMHWNGRRWSIVPSPNPAGSYLNPLWSVTTTSAGNAWAAGTIDYAQTLITHWNGKTWN
jgi:hypothetical protein